MKKEEKKITAEITELLSSRSETSTVLSTDPGSIEYFIGKLKGLYKAITTTHDTIVEMTRVVTAIETIQLSVENGIDVDATTEAQAALAITATAASAEAVAATTAKSASEAAPDDEALKETAKVAALAAMKVTATWAQKSLDSLKVKLASLRMVTQRTEQSARSKHSTTFARLPTTQL